MAPKKKPLAELGSIKEEEGTYRAYVLHRDAARRQSDIYRPKRGEHRRAEADLAQMRAAGAVGKTRASR